MLSLLSISNWPNSKPLKFQINPPWPPGTVKARKKPESIFKARVEFCAELGEVNLKEKDKQNRDFKKNVCKIMHQLHTKSPDLDSIAYTSTRSR